MVTNLKEISNSDLDDEQYNLTSSVHKSIKEMCENLSTRKYLNIYLMSVNFKTT